MPVGLSVDAVQAFLRQRLGASIEAVQAINHGEWSRAFFFRHAERDLVVRFSDYVDDFRKDERVAQYASDRLPIPNVLEIGQAFDCAYAISERRFGTFLEDRDAAGMQRLLPSMLEMLDALRDVDVSQTKGFGLWRGADGAAPYPTWREALLAIAIDPPSSRTHGWRTALEASAESARAFDAAFERMRSLLDACPDARHLVHSDLLNFNVLAQADRVSGVIDWGSSLYGDWLWDLAWISFWQPWYTAWSTVAIHQSAARHYSDLGLSVEHLSERLRCYELAIGLDGLAYQAFSGPGRADDLAWTTRRVLGLLDARMTDDIVLGSRRFGLTSALATSDIEGGSRRHNSRQQHPPAT